MASYTLLDDIDVPLIAARYGLDRLRLTPLRGGMANSSFRAEADQGDFVLTVLDNHDHGSAEHLAALTLKLFRRDVRTPAPMPTVDGGLVADMHGRPVILKRWIEGQALDQLPSELLPAAGMLLAEVHAVPTGDLGLPVGARRLSDEHRAAVDSFADRDFAHWLNGRLQGVLATPTEGRRPVLVHGDFHADNLVVHPDNQLSVLDWETATIDDPLLDIGMALAGHARVDGALAPGRAMQFVDGYCKVRGLTETDLRQLPTAVEHAALILAFHRYYRHNVRFPNPAKARIHQELIGFVEDLHLLSFTGDDGQRVR
ncbi:phosphotransferase [Streptomyces zingiberis]|uniref:Phosphotransferase n=1 Tax=Streptomyces zingiberis TaxID=2053010 RepID=A0ABX1BVR6_9ACTN|nr:phosphotransferase [Streptomyces zingiberis]NJQ01163.1 phosphotransferase [Streptomyces zingiberis]